MNHLEEIPTHKICLSCERDLPLDAFHKNKDCKYGVNSRCKECRSLERRGLGLRPMVRRDTCEDCGIDITHRGPTAKLCESCGKERNRASAQRYYDKDPEGCKQRIKERWENMPKEVRLAKSREQMLKEHGINQAIYDEALRVQNEVCKTCKKPETHMYQGVVVQLSVDHDHAHCPGKHGCADCFRGLLCHDCNAGLGYFDDDIEVMLAAVAYLQEWQLKKNETVA